MHCIRWVLLCFLFPLTSGAQESASPFMPEMTAVASVSSPSIGLAEILVLELELQFPLGYSVDSEAIQKSLLDRGEIPLAAFSLLERQEKSTIVEEAQTLTLRFTLEPEKLGTHYLDFGTISLRHLKEDRVQDVIVDPIAVTVDPNVGGGPLQPAQVLTLSQKPRIDMDASHRQRLLAEDLRQPQENLERLSRHIFPWHYIVLFLVSLVVLAGLVHAFTEYRKLLKQQKAIPPDPTKQAHSQIKDLAKHLHQQTVDNEAFYMTLTAILRSYIEKRYAIRAPEKTTEEFLEASMDNEVFPKESRERLAEVLQQADKIKFAQQESSPEACAQALSFAQHFIC